MTNGATPTRLRPALWLVGPTLLFALGCAGPGAVSRRMMTHAIRLHSMGDADIALEEARGVVDRDPSNLEVHWLYQDLLLASGRRRAAIDEYFHRVRCRQADGALRVLLERLEPRLEIRERALEQLLATERQERWVRLALAEASLEQGDPEEAERWIHGGAGVPPGRAALSIHLMSALGARRPDEALEIADEILSDDDLGPPPSAALIYAHLLRGETSEALETGRRAHPGDDRPAVHRAFGIAQLRGRFYRGAVRSFRDAGRRGGMVEAHLLLLAYHGAIQESIAEGNPGEAMGLIEEILPRFRRSGRLLALKALVIDRLGQEDLAIETMRRAAELSPASSELIRRARLFFVEKGKPVEALRVWRQGMPEGLERSPANLLSDRFREVERWSREAQRSPDRLEPALSLARAYTRAGWITEATSQYRRALRLGGQEPRVMEALREVTVFRRILRRIQAHLRGVEKEEAGIEEAIGAIARIVAEEGGEREASLDTDGLIDSYLFFGKEVNLLVRPRSPLLEYFHRFNHYLDVRETGGHLEVRVMELVGWMEEEESIFGKTYRWSRITTDRSPIRHPAGGTYWIAGTTSWSGKGFVVDVDTIRSTLFPGDGELPPVLAGAPAQEDDRRTVRHIPDLRLRLLGDAADRAGSIPAMLRTEVENVAQHEIGHVVDFSGLIPWARHPIRHLGILISHFFSTAAIASRYQIVAETFAIARSPDPRLALLSSLDWVRAEADRPDHLSLLFDDDPRARRVYARSSREILAGIVEEVAEHPARHPGIDRSRPVLEQVDRLGEEELRAIAWKIYDRAGGRR